MKRYTVTETANIYGVSRVTVWRWIKDKKIKAVQEEEGWEEYMIPESEIDPEKLNAYQNQGTLSLFEPGATSYKTESSSSEIKNVTEIITESLTQILENLTRLNQNQERIANSLEKIAQLMENSSSTPPKKLKNKQASSKVEMPEGPKEWERIRKIVTKAVEEHETKAALARAVGVSPSVIGKFVNKRRKRVARDTLRKLQEVVDIKI